MTFNSYPSLTSDRISNCVLIILKRGIETATGTRQRRREGRRCGGETQRIAEKGGQKVTGLSTLPVDRDIPGLRVSCRAAAVVGQRHGDLEEVTE